MTDLPEVGAATGTASLAWLVRDAPGDRVRAGLAAVAALLSHELAILIVPVAALLDVQRTWCDDRSAVASRRALLQFWGIVLIGVVGVGTLSVMLRVKSNW